MYSREKVRGLDLKLLKQLKTVPVAKISFLIVT
jgi:hypothetical protein